MASTEIQPSREKRRTLGKHRYGNRAKEDARNVLKHEHILQAWELRRGGASMNQIAKTMGVGIAAVHKWLWAYKDEWHRAASDVAEQGRLLGIDRMDRVILQTNQIINGLLATAVKDGKWVGDAETARAVSRAHMALIRADQRRSAYTGSDMPKESKQRVTLDATTPTIIMTVADMAKIHEARLENERMMAAVGQPPPRMLEARDAVVEDEEGHEQGQDQ